MKSEKTTAIDDYLWCKIVEMAKVIIKQNHGRKIKITVSKTRKRRSKRTESLW